METKFSLLYFSHFDLQGLNLPLNFTPNSAGTKYDDESEKWVTTTARRGEGQKVFKTMLNATDTIGDDTYAWVLISKK